jgi:hypothetical protein
LNKILIDSSHLAVPIRKLALELKKRLPFINDDPPGIYTAVRLVIPAINSLLTDAERDELQSVGSVEKLVTKAEVMRSTIVQGLQQTPTGLSDWVDSALQFLADELKCAKKVSGDPPQYRILIDHHLIVSDHKELLSDQAGYRAAREAKRGRKGARRTLRFKDQGNLFGDPGQ